MKIKVLYMHNRSWHLCWSRSRGGTPWEVVTCIACRRVIVADPGANTLAKNTYIDTTIQDFSLVLTYSILSAQPANPSASAIQAMYRGGSSRVGKHAMDMDNHWWALLYFEYLRQHQIRVQHNPSSQFSLPPGQKASSHHYNRDLGSYCENAY